MLLQWYYFNTFYQFEFALKNNLETSSLKTSILKKVWRFHNSTYKTNVKHNIWNTLTYLAKRYLQYFIYIQVQSIIQILFRAKTDQIPHMYEMSFQVF